MPSFLKVVLVLFAFILIYWALSYKSDPIIEDAVVENPDVVQDWTPEVSQPLDNKPKSIYKDERSDWEVVEGRSIHPADAKWYRKLKPKLDRKGFTFCGIRQELLSLEDELIAEADVIDPDFGNVHAEYIDRNMDKRCEKWRKRNGFTEEEFVKIQGVAMVLCM